MSQSVGLTTNFRDLVDKIDDVVDILSDEEHRIELINNRKWAVTYVELSSKFIIGGVYFFIWLFVSSLIDSGFIINAIGSYIALVMIDNFVVAPVFKKKYDERLKHHEKQLERLERDLDDLMNDKLLPEVYPLGMMTAQNIIDKTSAKYLPIEYVQEFMENEVKRGNFEKIKLNNDVLYKGKHPQSLSNMKTIVLEVD